MKNVTLTFTCLLLAFMLASCSQGAPAEGANAAVSAVPVKGQSAVKDDASEQNILNVAINSKDHSTLVAGVQAAGLEDVLVNAGPMEKVQNMLGAAGDVLGTVTDRVVKYRIYGHVTKPEVQVKPLGM